MKILVCDDAGFIRHIIREIISDHDVTLFEAANGKQALEIASSTKPDLVLLDIVLPKKNGIEVAKVLKAQDPRIRIVGISTLNHEQIHKIHNIDGVFDQFIEKPFSKADIQKAIGF